MKLRWIDIPNHDEYYLEVITKGGPVTFKSNEIDTFTVNAQDNVVIIINIYGESITIKYKSINIRKEKK